MKLSTEAVARTASQHPWRALAAWGIAVLASLAVVVSLLGGALTSHGEVTNNPESKQAKQLRGERIGHAAETSDVIVVSSRAYTVGDPRFRSKVRRVIAVAGKTGVVAAAQNYYESRERALVSHDRHALLIPLTLRTDQARPLVDAVEQMNSGPFAVSITGGTISDVDFEQLSQDDLRTGELFFGAPAALVILILVFGAVVAGLVPIILALISIVVALALTAVIGQAFELSVFVVNMLTGMGLALGIDYSLFILSRYRQERAAGREKPDAIAAAARTASRAVLFSGVAFVLAMVGMVLVPDTILRSLAAGAILVGIVSVLAALTLLPALLSLLGDRVNALQVPLVGRRPRLRAGREGRFSGALVAAVMRRPLASLALALAVLIVAAAPVLDLRTGSAGISTLPNRFPSKQGFVALNAHFEGQTTSPAFVTVDGDVTSQPLKDALVRLRQELAAEPAFGPVEQETYPQKRLAILTAPIAGDAQGERAVAAVKKLRSELIPRAFSGADARALVGGDTAETIDYAALTSSWLPRVFIFVLGLSFILLTVAFRSLVVPATAILMNLLSVGAAYGLLVLVFQKGVGNELFGFAHADSVEAWVPLFLFSVLFGLSMDYQVFLLSRIRERFSTTGDNRSAVAYGVGSTARIITGAALIIIAVFSGFARGDLVMFQQMGFGVATALLIDATVIRSIVVPAAMALLGNNNWYLPSWLRWLPNLSVESTATGDTMSKVGA